MATITLIGAPVDSGQRRRGCLMGPAAYRVAGLRQVLSDLGHAVADSGDLAPTGVTAAACANPMAEGKGLTSDLSGSRCPIWALGRSTARRR